MKKTFISYFISIFLLLCFIQQTVAEVNGVSVVPATTTSANPTWYYIESSVKANGGTLLYAPNATSGVVLMHDTKSNIAAGVGLDNALWAVVNDGSGLRLKNKGTGLFLDAGSTCVTSSIVNLALGSINKTTQYTIMSTAFAQAGATNTVTTTATSPGVNFGNPTEWFFILPGSTLPDAAPVENTWYFIKGQRNKATNSLGNTWIASAGDTKVMVTQAFTGSDIQCWKKVVNGTGFAFQNKADGTFINTSGSTSVAVQPAAPLFLTASAYVANGFYIENNPVSYRIQTTDANLVNSVNGAGTDSWDLTASSFLFYPVTAPDAPATVTAVAGNGSAAVTVTQPTNSLTKAAVTTYTVTSNPGNFTATGISPVTVTGLTNGTAYTFTAVANSNGFGSSAASASSNSVTPVSVPDAPTSVVATRGNAQASVAFTAPANAGSSPIIDYTVTSSPGNFTQTGASSPLVVTGLTNGTAYTFTITARNANGSSIASTASAAITPAGVPSAPTVSQVFTGNGQAIILYTASTGNGGDPITSYTATSTPGGITSTLTKSGSGTIIVNGLTNGTPYTFNVTANNSVGSSSASVASASVTPNNTYTFYTVKVKQSGKYIKDAGLDTKLTQTTLTVGDASQLWRIEESAPSSGTYYLVSKLGRKMYWPDTNPGERYFASASGSAFTINYAGVGFCELLRVGSANYLNCWAGDVFNTSGNTQVGQYNVSGDAFNLLELTKVEELTPQTITFGAIAPKTTDAAAFDLDATTDAVGLAVSYTSTNPAVATVTGKTVIITATADGYTDIIATQDGNASYAPAQSVTQRLTVSKVTATKKVDAATLLTVKNNMIYVTDPSVTVKAYTITGTEVDATKALIPGIYIIKVGQNTVKINVN